MDLVEILKNVPKGTKLWSVIHGEVKFLEINLEEVKYPIVCESLDLCVERVTFTKDGKYVSKYKVNAYYSHLKFAVIGEQSSLQSLTPTH